MTSSLHGDVLVVTFSGASNDAKAEAMTRRYFEILHASGRNKVLADVRPLRGRLSSAATFFLVRNLPVERVPRGIQTAIVEAAENREFADFLETTAANAGVHFRCFLDYDAALAWLESPAPAPGP
ncbi:MAG: hypothetical protein WAO95_14690 [Burkholderiales bacterium]